MTATLRTRFVEDLAPGDRIGYDGLKAVVHSAIPNENGEFVVRLVNSSDDTRTELLLARGTKVEIR
ncbi:hypothetical protein AAFP30_03300 [Gordonia sp. CPCC 205515]|uniref:hypothetical protein n=1 Tax=Gordonia sp. CPCC 205515 TaxID=3140791 RepID=UPI003AF3EE89